VNNDRKQSIIIENTDLKRHLIRFTIKSKTYRSTYARTRVKNVDKQCSHDGQLNNLLRPMYVCHNIPTVIRASCSAISSDFMLLLTTFSSSSSSMIFLQCTTRQSPSYTALHIIIIIIIINFVFFLLFFSF